MERAGMISGDWTSIEQYRLYKVREFMRRDYGRQRAAFWAAKAADATA